jgi:hypothetical protein
MKWSDALKTPMALEETFMLFPECRVEITRFANGMWAVILNEDLDRITSGQFLTWQEAFSDLTRRLG